MFSFSTCWNAERHKSGEGIIKEIKELGFQKIEVSCYYINEKKAKDILRLKKRGEIVITSVHNFCPNPLYEKNPEGGGGIFNLISEDAEERKEATKYTKETIDYAHQLGAQVVVMHLGEENKEIDYFKGSFKDKKEELKYENKYNEWICSLKEKRAKMQPIYLERILPSLQVINDYAKLSGVKIGVENRYFYYQFPNIEEMDIIFKNFPNSSLYYWHDVGHAQVLENIGFVKHEEWLKRFSQRMVGVHLHDLNLEGEDHQAPPQGGVDFEMIKRYLNKEVLKVLELNKKVKKSDIILGYKFLRSLFSD